VTQVRARDTLLPLDKHHRPDVLFACSNDVVDRSDHQDAAEHCNCPVPVRRTVISSSTSDVQGVGSLHILGCDWV